MNLFFPMLLTGFVTSFHCIMMCGNLVLSYAIKGSEEGPLLRRMLPHIGYHTAKIASYVAVGLLLGSVGDFISAGARSWVSVVAGAYMIVLGLTMTGKFPWLAVLTPRPPKWLMNAITKLRKRSSADADAGSPHLATPVTFGLMTGLMPCGPLQAAQLAAAGAGSALSGATVMLGFGLGTAPLMLGYGALASYLSGKFKQRMALVAAVVIMVLGLVMIDRGATALGSPVNFNAIRTAALGAKAAPADAFKRAADGAVEIPLVIENTRYVPDTVSLPANEPVRLVVDRREDNSCSDELWIPQLGIAKKLTPNGVTSIDIPASKAGTYQMTCQMGMMSGSVVIGGGAASGPSPWVWVLGLGAIGIAGAFYALRTPASRKAPGLFGFNRIETIIVGVALFLAVLAGLVLGGYFS